MQNPVTGKQMQLKTHYNRVFYRNRSIFYKQVYYYCEETKMKCTNPEIDARNLAAMIKAYAEVLNAELVILK